MNAPRLLRDAAGDFTAQVKVGGDFQPAALDGAGWLSVRGRRAGGDRRRRSYFGWSAPRLIGSGRPTHTSTGRCGRPAGAAGRQCEAGAGG